MNYQESRRFVEESAKYSGELGLTNIREMMERLGNPQDTLKFVHVAGTNGKGSVVMYLYTTLREAGYRVGRYISPTLYSYRERLEAAGEQITQEEFARCVTRVAGAISDMVQEGLPHPTPFEIETAVAFLYFQEKQCDLVILEVGMGGNLDATNIITTTKLAVLTSISMDHQAYLGNTLAEIAEKKSGILKPGGVALTTHQPPEVMRVISEKAGELFIRLVISEYHHACSISESLTSQTFRYQEETYEISLAGVCQIENAVLALNALECLGQLGFPTTLSQRKAGLKKTVWNGRFTVIHERPYVIVDGAHNPGAAEKLALSIEHYLKGRRIFYIMGVFRDKDYETVIRRTCSYADKIWTIATPDNPRALPAEELAETIRKYHPDVTAAESMEQAVSEAFQEAEPEDVILTFGSLSFIGELTKIVEMKTNTMEGTMVDLQESRKKIDEIDTEILRLFEERMKVSEDVARYKIETGKQVLDRERELQKIAAFKEKAHGEFNITAAQELLKQIMSISRKRQYQLLDEYGLEKIPEFRRVDSLPMDQVRVVFQGVEGAYSYAAMKTYFDEKTIESYHVKTWKDAMEEVSRGKADYAVLPIENSTAGIVADIYDLLMEYQLYIVGEQIIRVDHVLLGLPGTDMDQIKTVHSHPQGLAQCKQFLESHPSWRTVKEANTAGSAKIVHEMAEHSHAAIASREAGELYGLEILAENICQNGQNVTRFIIVSKEPYYEKQAGKISICAELPHESGTLYNMLSHIIFNGLNMTKIESRPIPGKTWEYRFFVDFEGNLEDSAVKNALRGIYSEASRMRVLGNYEN